jgi:hypothetical protein
MATPQMSMKKDSKYVERMASRHSKERNVTTPQQEIMEPKDGSKTDVVF